MAWQHKTTRAKVNTELKTHLKNVVSAKTVRRELHKANIPGRSAIAKPFITEGITKLWKKWCHDKRKTWTLQDWKNMLCSDECSSHYFLQTARFIMENPTRSLRFWLDSFYSLAWGDPIKIWVTISWYSAGPLIQITGLINANEYLEILNDEVLTVSSILLPNTAIFQNDHVPIHSHKFQPCFEEIIKHLSWPQYNWTVMGRFRAKHKEQI